MKVVRFDEYGEPAVLQVREAEKPVPQAGQVLVRVESVGVNYADTARRRNQYLEPTPLPFVLGGEIVGTVEERGPGVDSPALGAKVAGIVPSGAYAQYALLDARQAFPVPEAFDADIATALFVQGLTAWLIFRGTIAPLKAGESVLIQGAAGGVGSLAVQLARHFGAGNVVGLASTEEKRALCKQFGAHAAVDYAEPDWPKHAMAANGGKGFDMILEIAGGDAVARDFEALAPWGRIIIFGNASRTQSQLDPIKLMHKNSSIVGFWLTPYFAARGDVIRAAFLELAGLVASGRLKPHIGLVLPLERAAEAHAQLEGRATTGKVVLKPFA